MILGRVQVALPQEYRYRCLIILKTDRITDMSDFDRLSTLMERFSLDVRPAPLEAAMLVVEGRGVARKALLRTGASGFGISADRIVFAAAVDWGGAANPLMSALPEFVDSIWKTTTKAGA